MYYIEVKNLNFFYGNEPVLIDVNYHVSNNELVILRGENGSAKSTLIKLTLGLLKPNKGSCHIAKKNIWKKNIKIGYLPQHISSLNNGFPGRVIELVRSGRYVINSWRKKLTTYDNNCIRKALESVDMWKFRNKSLENLSVGQKQRVILARLFAYNPDLFILDEPTAGMDEKSCNEFYSLMTYYTKQNSKGILLVTHDSKYIDKYANRKMYLVRKEDSKWKYFHLIS